MANVLAELDIAHAPSNAKTSYEPTTVAEIHALLEEGRLAREAGLTRPFDEVMDDIERKILDGTI